MADYYSKVAKFDTSENLYVRTAGSDVTDGVDDVRMSNSYEYIATATTTAVKDSPGHLHSITIGETAAGAITIYDNTAGSGTIIGVLKASIAEQTFVFDVDFAVGLTIVTAGASKLTVSYS